MPRVSTEVPQQVIDNDFQALWHLGFSESEIDETLKSPHGGSRKGKGGETAAKLRFDAWMKIAGEPVKNDPKFVCLGGEYGAAGAKFVQEGEVDAFQWRNLSTNAGWMSLSKYMACGCISPREMYHTLLKQNHWALPGVVHRFMWREWHRINAIKYKTHLFRLQGPGGQVQFLKCGASEEAQKWKHGMTGIPYIDACMRELNATGWIPYHQRKTTACFLCHDLKVDWRFGGFHYEEVLLDYDVAMNYGNWTFCARVDKEYGDRYTAQAYRDPEHWSVHKSIQANAANDPDGSYIRQWVPELKNVPQDLLQCPWMMSVQQQAAANCIIGKDYAEPIVKLPGTEGEQKELGRVAAVWNNISSSEPAQLLEKFFKFPAVGMCFLFIVYMSGRINDPNNLGKQLCIVCTHNMVIGYLFDRTPGGVYVGFPHFGPLSVDVPVLRILARFWSYEMVAIRFATALRPLYIPGLFASFMSLIIPQMAVFAPWQLGGALSKDYFKNPISFASVNGFPALIWLIYFLIRQLSSMPVTNFIDLHKNIVDLTWNTAGKAVTLDWIGIALFVLPFLGLAGYMFISIMARDTHPKTYLAYRRACLGTIAAFIPCLAYVLHL